MATPSRVRIGNCRDAAEAALVRAVLTAHDIPVHISGEHHAAMLGLGASAIEQVIWVGAEDAEEAAALLRELRHGGEAVLADDEVPADDLSEREDEASPGGALVTSGEDTLTRLGKRKRIVLAVIVGMSFGHGFAHFSTRAWMRGLALGVVQLVGLLHLGAGNDLSGAAMIVGGRIADIVGAVWEIARRTSPIATARAVKTR